MAGTEDVIVDTACDYLQLVPAGTELFQADYQLHPQSAQETILRECLKSLQDDYEYIIIDSPSSLGPLTICSLVAADSLLFPLLCRPDAVEQLGYLLQLVVDLRKRFPFRFTIAGIVFNRCNHLDEVRKVISEEAYKSIKDIVLPVTIPFGETPDNAAEGVGKPFVMDDVMLEPSQQFFHLTSALAG